MFTRTDPIKVLNQRATWAEKSHWAFKRMSKRLERWCVELRYEIVWVHCLGPSFPRKVVIASTKSPKQFRNTAQHKTAWIHAQQQKGQCSNDNTIWLNITSDKWKDKEQKLFFWEQSKIKQTNGNLKTPQHAKFNVLNCSPSSFKDFLEDREALADPVLGLLVRTGCCSFWFGVRGRNLTNITIQMSYGPGLFLTES